MKMLRLASLALIAIGVSIPAMAADLPMKSPTAYAPPCCDRWVGFYVGAHGGYGWMTDDFSLQHPAGSHIGGVKAKGWVWGGQAGYNWQYSSVVAGLEVDFGATKISGLSAPVTGTQQGTEITWIMGDDVKYLGTARARVGYAPVSSFLLYATAGLALEQGNQLFNRVAVFAPQASVASSTITPFTWFGWVAGAGVEAKLFGSNWIGRVEYLHYDFGATRAQFNQIAINAPGNSSFSEHVGHQTIDVVRAGLSYRFCDCAERAAY